MKKKSEGGVILISFLLIIMVLFIGVSAFYGFAYSDFNATLRNEFAHQAVYAAEAGIDQKLTELLRQNTTNISGNLNLDAAGIYREHYEVFYGVVQQDPQSGNKVAVNPDTGTQVGVSQYAVGNEVLISTGSVILSGVERARKVLRATVRKGGVVNPRAAVAISGIASTNGSVIVDGREHDSDGNLTGAPGVYGISTSSSTFNQGGNSKVGGNGIAPAKPANPASYEVNAPALSTTPEGILGLDSGALDSYQTTTPPSGPFNGILYLTSSWDGVNLEGSSGILICHNSAGTAYLKNIHGTFKGLIISDDIIHINGDSKIIGAVYGMKTGGVTLGNGSGEVKFSTQVLSSLPLLVYDVTSWEDASNDSSS